MSVNPDWWRDFFKGLPVELWLRAATPEMTLPEVDYLEKALGLTPAMKVLDVPCGGGRHVRELSRRGYHVEGVDFSRDFLDHARREAPELTWHERDMRDLPWEAHFDAAYCWGNSFGYMDDASNRDFLHAVARVLKPGGRFAMAYGAVAESILPAFKEKPWYELGDILFLIHNRHNAELSRLESTFTFARGAERALYEHSQRIYTFREVCELMRQAGFDEFVGHGSLQEEPYRLGSQWLLLTATKV